MRYFKTPGEKRGSYKLFDDDGRFIAEYKPGENGITEVDIINLHRLDDHEVYINNKELRLPEWYQPIYDKWKEKFIADFKKQYGREPHKTEIPDGRRQMVSIDAQLDMDGDGICDKSRLDEKLSVSDEEDIPDTIIRLREIIAEMPEQWQTVYQLVFIKELSKAAAGRIIGVSDVRVGQLVRKIKAVIKKDKILKNFFK